MLDANKHFPADAHRFTFDKEVAEIFDDMAARSLPGYDYVYRRISDLVARMDIPHYSQVWDFGTSTGAGLVSVQRVAKHPYIHYLGCDISVPMTHKAKEKCPMAQIIEHDLTKGLPKQVRQGEVAVAMFGWTLQFLESYTIRQSLLVDAYNALIPGGYLFVMEKYKAVSQFDNTLEDSYINWRRQNGYTLEEIQAKSTALRGSMFPWSMPSLYGTMIEQKPTPLVGLMYQLFNFAGTAFQKPKD